MMRLEGGTFAHTDLPGLDTSVPSLLLHTTPNGCMVQATAAGLRVLSPLPQAQHLISWQPEGKGSAARITLASAAGSVVVVATTTHLISLKVVVQGQHSPAAATASGSSASLHVVSQAGLQQQVSALHACHIAPGCSSSSSSLRAKRMHSCDTVPAQGRDSSSDSSDSCVCVIVGHWVQNDLMLMPAGVLDSAVQRLNLGFHTARSAAVLPLPDGRQLLGVGTNAGELLLWDLAATDSSWEVRGGTQVAVSNVAVELSIMPASIAGGH
jgi:hypothetical protein